MTHRLLKDHGVLFLEVTNNGGLFFQVADVFHRIVGDQLTSHLSPTFVSYQIYGFSPRSLRALLEQTGFRVERLMPWGGVPEQTARAGGSVSARSGAARARRARDAVLRAGVDSAMRIGAALGRGHTLTALAVKVTS
jgi:hypothetical protein